MFSILWERAEDMVLQAWLAAVCPCVQSHLSLHFEGMRLGTDEVAKLGGQQECCEKAARAIQEATLFSVRLAIKEHKFLLEQLHATSPTHQPLPPEAAVLLQDGNCILAALWRFREALHTDTFGAASMGRFRRC